MATLSMGATPNGETVAMFRELLKIPSDYGRSKGIAWYALLGYGKTQTAALEHRIVKWDSAV